LTITPTNLNLIKSLRPEGDVVDPRELLMLAHLSVISEPGEQSYTDAIAERGVLGAFPDITLADIQKSATIKSLLAASRSGVRMLIPSDDLYPNALADLESPPIVLWVRGTDEALASLNNSVAIVGARAATGYGEHVTMEMSAGLTDRGFTVVSTGAYGVDGMTLRAALASNGSPVAVLAGGLDKFYPAGNDALLSRVATHGAVISEIACGKTPTKWRFTQRNRIVAAITQVTVVTEAGYRSGSLGTAGFADSLGRAVGAMPGPVTSAASAGCHKLIADGTARLVTDVEQVVALLPHE
tara:strand:- start:14374 stop:15267 length:894 start_codon:yes stop_codon:yes gene_type:complete